MRRSALAAGVSFVVAATLLASASPAPQRRGGGGGGGGRNQGGAMAALAGSPWIYDGSFVFCRLATQGSNGDGGSWWVDWDRADLNFPFRLAELTKAPVSQDRRGEPNHVIVDLMDPHLFQCPFIMLTEPGGAYIDDEEATNLRAYLEKGGFLWADDFWGERAWFDWERQLRKALPENEFPIRDVPRDHPLFHIDYPIREIPQIPSIDFWFSNGYRTSERGFDSEVPHVRAAEDSQGRILVLMTHNTDFGDAFQREGEDRRYFNAFAARAYAFGVNVYLYAMTH